uniref:Elongator complex protein 2 n=1 Tax=Kalmanozyma brasiliensis (strain GHG001) TaxID=1365824 RepID=V5ESK5_KALBG
MAPQASSSYISAAFNRCNHIADWANAPHSIIAYAANKSIAIWDQPGHASSAGVTQLLATGFSKAITSLKLANLTVVSDKPCIVAGSADGSIGVWALQENTQWTQVQCIKAAHNGSVSALGVIRSAQSASELPSIIVSGASDGVLKVWTLSNDLSQPPTLAQSIDLKGRFPLDLSLLPLPNTTSTQLLMALATTTNKIDIFASSPSSAAQAGAHRLKFQHKLSLEGHEDWVKSLDLCNTFVETDDVHRNQNPVTGHFAAAKSVAWEPCGEYLLSCSDDQTTRLHAKPFSRNGQQLDASRATWHEVARPQSHGYDLHSVSWLDRLNFVSAADEKVLRVFAAPRGFVGTAGKNGLHCATLGSESESRAASRPAAGNKSLLHLSVEPHSGLLKSAEKHGYLFKQTVEQCCKEQSDSVTAIVSSPLFQRPFDGLSFKQIELYLKWLYAQAWSVAVQRGLMLADINVLLVPDTSLEKVALRLHAPEADVLVDASIDQKSTSIWQELGVTVRKIDSGHQQSDAAGAVGQDDGKGLKCYPVVALGGTFDHLHVGHKILLTMASIIADTRIIVGVTDDAMLTKKSNAHLLEPIDERIACVNAFISFIRLPFTPIDQQVVKLEDVAGPAATEADLQALVVTDETLSGAEFIDNKRKENGLSSLEDWVIGVVGSEGQTDLKGDAKALAESKVGSTAIRKWLVQQGPRRVQALETAKRHRVSHQLRLTTSDQEAEAEESNVSSRPVGASVPPLGLSNRAVFEGSSIQEAPSASGQPIGSAKESLSAVLRQPPSEEQLSVETLWPELEKLYGHGYELLWVSANPPNPVDGGRTTTGGRFVASCCKATSEDHAVVRIHDRAQNWRECAVLEGHSLSITRIQWSLDSRYLLTCSRDRSWRMYEQVAGERFVPFTGERSHARIIWDCAWSTDPARPYVFATASRDKTVKIFELWPKGQEGERPFALLQTIKFNEAVTAIAFGVDAVLAVGKEDGEVEILQRKAGEGEEWSTTLKVPNLAEEQINQLAWRPPVLEDGDDAILASASEDGAVRLTRITGL